MPRAVIRNVSPETARSVPQAVSRVGGAAALRIVTRAVALTAHELRHASTT